jgi:hypothetical protein
MTRRIVLDANLLLLLVIGSNSREFVGKHKRLEAYSPDDFDLLTDVVSSFDEMVVTPNVLTEASNLLGYGVREPWLSRFQEGFRALVEGVQESYIRSTDGVARSEFPRLGLTDSILLELLRDQGVLLTRTLTRRMSRNPRVAWVSALFLAVCVPM